MTRPRKKTAAEPEAPKRYPCVLPDAACVPAEPELRGHLGHLHVVAGSHLALWEEVPCVGHELREATFRFCERLFVTLSVFLASRGWVFTRNPICVRPTERHQSPWWLIGHGPDDVCVALEVGGRTMSLDFFEVATPKNNPNGQQYDHQQVSKMPARQRLRVLVEAGAVYDWFRSRYGYDLKREANDWRDPALSGAAAMRDAMRNEPRPHEESPLRHFLRHWGGHVGKDRRDAAGWPPPERFTGGYPGDTMKDRDGVPFAVGDERFCRDDKGRLFRGRVYPNMNGQWWVVGPSSTERAWTNKGLFLCDRPRYARRRFVGFGGVDKLKHMVADAARHEQFERAAVLRNARDGLQRESERRHRRHLP